MQPSDGFVEANGLRMHYLVWGGGVPDVILLHGSLSTCHVWDFFAQAICADYHVLVPDLRGYGMTEAPQEGYSALDYAQDLYAFAHVLGIERFHLIGHSMGTRIGTIYASRYPQQLISLVLVDTTGFMRPEARERSLQAEKERQLRFASAQEAMEYLSTKHNKNFWSREVLEQRVAKEMNHFPDGSVEWMYTRDVLFKVREAHADDVLPYARDIRCPTLILRGSESPNLTQEDAQRLGELIPHSQVVEIPRAAHYIHLDNRPEFERVVRAFLDRHNPSRG